MTANEIITAILGVLNLLAVCFLPKAYSLFKSVNDLEKEAVRLNGEIEKNAQRVDHMNNNVKQGMEYLKESMESLKDDLSEIKTEIREIILHGRN